MDTESVRTDAGSKAIQRWRLGVTAFDGWDQYRKQPKPVEWKRHTTPLGLWEYAGSCVAARNRLVVCGHNVGFDLRIADAFGILPALGWRLDRPAMTPSSVMLKARRADGASLLIIDSYAWLPKALADIGRMVGQVKLPDPEPDDVEGWYQRCTTDVNILRAAMLHLIHWVEADDLGTWQKTGAGQAWTTWRHRFLTHAPIVHDDAEVKAIEQESTYAGRCEAWKHGLLRGRRWVDLDLPLAYAHICRDLNLPVRLRGRVVCNPYVYKPVATPHVRRLYHGVCSTDLPVLPTRHAGRIIWPVGMFSGWWWDDELATAVEAGATVTVDRYLEYVGQPALRAFSVWALSVCESMPDEYTEVQRTAVKHWTRAIVGKFGAAYPRWDEIGPPPDCGVGIEKVWNADKRRIEHLMTCAGRAWWSDHDELADDAVPAIQSAVVSEGRRKLWVLITTAGLPNVAYVDTDGLVVNVTGYRRLMKAAKAGGLWGLREKRRTSELVVEGPRQILWEDSHRWAGIPHAADRVGEMKWEGERWESLKHALERGEYSTVTTWPTVWEPAGSDTRRLHLARHRTAPITLAG